MRPDVKLGVVFSMVIVLVAGSYFLYRDKGDGPIQVADGPESLADPSAGKTPSNVLAGAEHSRTTQPSREGVRKSRSPQQAGTPDGRAVRRGTTPSASQARETRPHTAPPGAGHDATTRAPGESPRKRSTITPTQRRPRRKPNVKPPQLADGTSDQHRAPDADQQLGDGKALPTPIHQPSDRLAGLDHTSGQGPDDAAETPLTRSRRAVSLVSARPAATGGAKQPAGAAEAGAVDTHRVQSGDTLSSLAMLYYGSERYTRFLIDSNPHLTDPNRIRVGMVIKIPPRPLDDTLQRRATSAAESDSTPATGGRRTYRVQPGDSFYAIARDVLHDTSRWKELFELNRELVKDDPTHLQVGQVLVLPNP